jgi:peptidyl-tRNA hydrolase, PTH1 family
MTSVPIKAIIGLCNHGSQYANTRHNAGAWLIERLGEIHSSPLRTSKNLFGRHTQIQLANQTVHLLAPSTFMNHSGKSVAALTSFYKIQPEQLLVAHDELDFDPGIARLKLGGGHAGHNGLRDIIKATNSNNFLRTRIGIGHPGNRNKVSDYVLNTPNKHDKQLIDTSIEDVLYVIDDIISGHIKQAMQRLHSQP